MTKKLTTTKFPTELDLDSFLGLHSDFDDDDSAAVPHRTLDEILNDSDSSTSLSPPSSPASLSNLPQNDAISQDSTESLNRTQSQLLGDRLDQARHSSFTRGGFLGDPVWRAPSSSSSRPLPSLFGGVRSNAKPGAALAAAAAASRSVPTPHAAAIKSRRAVTLQKVMDSGDDHEIVSNSSFVASERMESDDKLAEIDDLDSTTGEVFDSNSKVLEGEVEDTEAAPLNTEGLSITNNDQNLLNNNTSTSNVNVKLDLNDDSILGSYDRKDEAMAMDIPASSRDDDYESNEMPLEDGDNLEKGKDDESGDGDASSLSDISDLVEERIGKLESERIIKNAEKKLKENTMKPLELAEELEKKQASTGLHLEEGAAAQPMKLEGVRRGSTTLGYFDIDANNAITRTIMSQTFRRDHGSPQVLAVHLNHIAVGMGKGVIAVVPSRYSPYNGDNMDSKMLMLGLQGDRSYAPVTSMCFNQQGDLLLAGYGDGHITVWDIQRASVAKVITGEHTAPVVHALFLGQDSQVTRQFKAVTGDSKGHVYLHSFSVVPLLNRFTIKTQCLLDGQRTGIVLSASPLLFDESSGGALPSSQGNASVSSSSIGNMMGGVVGGDAGWKLFNEGSSPVEEGVVIFVTHQTALVVRLTPTLEVYAQLSKPDGVREGSMPYTAWKCTSQSHSSEYENISADAAERVSLLAVAWDRKVQVAKLIKSELKVYGTWSLDSAAIGVTWLDAHMLVVLTLTGQLYLFAKDGTVIHQTSFAVDGSGGDDLVAYHTHFINIYGNPEKAYHNSLAVRGASVYILGPTHLVVSRLLPWKERIQVLRRAGDWMGALNMAMTLYDGQAHGVIDLPKSVDAVQETIMPYLVELLLSYVDEVFSYISVAFCNQIGKVEQQDESKTGGSSVHSEIKEQFTRVGGVAVEFCVHIHRTDILFDEIFSKFMAVQHRDTFLELLEPYILRDMLGSLPPEIMQALVEHYSSRGWLQRVEQCVLHMDISSLDFNQVVRLCREHGLYGALVYLFNKGLDDFRAPLEELLIASRNSHKESAAALGYRMLVYLKYCFSGLAFPPGQGALPPKRLPSLRTDLVQFLLEKSSALNSVVDSTLSSRRTYLNLYHLLELDTEATLDVLRLAFLDDENPKSDFSSDENANVDIEAEQDNIANESQILLAQNAVDALVQIIEKDIPQTAESASADDTGLVEAWPSKKDIGNLFEFIAYHVACRKARVSGSVLSQILEYLTSESNFYASIHAHDIQTSKRREKQVLALLEVVPETDWNSSYVLQLCEKAQFHQVCGFIHTIRNQHLAALDCYMKDVDEPIHTFSYIYNILRQLTNNEHNAFQSAIMSKIPELVVLSREGTFLLIRDHFQNDSPRILSRLQSHPKSLFLYLKTVIEVHLSGTLNFSRLKKDDSVDAFSGRRVEDQLKGLEAYLERISDFPKFIRNNPVNVTDDMIELYMELLCQYERNSVLKFLETFESYRVENCLRLCQEYEITDAAAFLLERVGDVGSALLLTLTQLNDKFVNLDIAVESLISTSLSSSIGTDQYGNVLRIKEVDDIYSILNVCIGLCQRNTPRLQPEESETLWFKLLDSFCAPLMDSFTDKRVSKRDDHAGMLTEALGEHEDDEAIIKWKISKSHKGAHILRKLLSQFIKEIVEGMIGYVHLPTIMSKLLSDNGNQEFGDFKITILGMLGTYGFERRILDTAKSLIEDDTFYTMSLLKKGASHGYAPRSLVCCICNCPLTKDSPSFRIRVFSCGHATHLQCELLESETSSKGSLSGCPICMPKTNTQRPRNKSVLGENGLVNKVSSRAKRAHGTGTLHSHEDSSDNSYGLQQMSRFEILTNLQKDQRLVQIENMPQLRLAPPAVYHERVKKGPEVLTGESSSAIAKRIEKSSKRRQLRELKVTGSSLRFPLKSSIFGKEKINKR
ncbi:vacuolar protein sorting-associated protein 8 homolog [Ricinus communis]|uniref:vacuolar protein sorting-associated protein 8 homolog n=1 Tax=Ricinus communis TaxID=3988 RepID=UPI00201ACC04|nr:vacuolar protein sorting-associated protein 8 homolog [Ricinus communis]